MSKQQFATSHAEEHPVCQACGHINGAHLAGCRVAELERELNNFRTRAYLSTARCDGSGNHSTGCLIWGDDGQGKTREGWEPKHCSCGALPDWLAKQTTRSEIPRSDDTERKNVSQSLRDMIHYGGNVDHEDRKKLLWKAIDLIRTTPSHVAPKLRRWTLRLSSLGLNPKEDENGAYVLYSDLQTTPSTTPRSGWKLVPTILTPEQVVAAIGVIGMARISSDQYQAIYTAELNAAPQGPASTGATEPCSVLPAGAAPFRPINEREAEIVAFYEAQLARVSVPSATPRIDGPKLWDDWMQDGRWEEDRDTWLYMRLHTTDGGKQT